MIFLLARKVTGQKMRFSVEENLEVDNARSLHRGSRHIFDSKDIVGKAQGMTSEGARFLLSNWRLPPCQLQSRGSLPVATSKEKVPVEIL